MPSDRRQRVLSCASAERISARDGSSLYRVSQYSSDDARYYAFIAMYSVIRRIDDAVDGDAAGLSATFPARTGSYFAASDFDLRRSLPYRRNQLLVAGHGLREWAHVIHNLRDLRTDLCAQSRLFSSIPRRCETVA